MSAWWVLKSLVDPYRTRVAIQTKVLMGALFLEIIREVLRNGRDLVIKIPETQDWLDRMLGFADMNLLRNRGENTVALQNGCNNQRRGPMNREGSIS